MINFNGLGGIAEGIGDCMEPGDDSFTATGATGVCDEANGTYTENGTYNGATAYQNENGWWIWLDTSQFPDIWRMSSVLGSAAIGSYEPTFSPGPEGPPTDVDWLSQGVCGLHLCFGQI